MGSACTGPGKGLSNLPSSWEAQFSAFHITPASHPVKRRIFKVCLRALQYTWNWD
jgi:hypothetical protein